MLLLLTAALSVGDPMPHLEGENLAGKKTALPDDAKGKVTLVAVGFSYESRRNISAWTMHFHKEFSLRQDVTFYEVRVIGGLARFAKFFIDSGMRRSTPRDDLPRVMPVYGNAVSDEWKEHTGSDDAETAHLLLLDRDGKVRWIHSGTYDETAWNDLKQATQEVLRAGT